MINLFSGMRLPALCHKEALHTSALLSHTLSRTFLDAGSGPKTLTSGWLSPVSAEQREMSATQRSTLNQSNSKELELRQELNCFKKNSETSLLIKLLEKCFNLTTGNQVLGFPAK